MSRDSVYYLVRLHTTVTAIVMSQDILPNEPPDLGELNPNSWTRNKES